MGGVASRREEPPVLSRLALGRPAVRKDLELRSVLEADEEVAGRACVYGQDNHVFSLEQLTEHAIPISLIAGHRVEIIPASDVSPSLVPDPPPALYVEGVFPDLVLGAVPSLARKPPTEGEHLHVDGATAPPHPQAFKRRDSREDRLAGPAPSDSKRADEPDRFGTIDWNYRSVHDHEAALVHILKRGADVSGRYLDPLDGPTVDLTILIDPDYQQVLRERFLLNAPVQSTISTEVEVVRLIDVDAYPHERIVCQCLCPEVQGELTSQGPRRIELTYSEDCLTSNAAQAACGDRPWSSGGSRGTSSAFVTYERGEALADGQVEALRPNR